MSREFFRLNRWDLALCGLVVLLALALAGGLALRARGESVRVEIAREGEILYQGPLAGVDTQIQVPGDYPMTVVIRQGQVWVEQSACPGGDCRRQGAISRPGQSIACLPNRVTVALRGEAEVDVVVGQ